MLKYDPMDPPAPPKKHKGWYYGWFPKPTNPSKVILHRWNPESDTWEELTSMWFLPSKAWGSWTEEDK